MTGGVAERRERAYRSNELDLWYTGQPAWFVLGAVAPHSDADIARALNLIAAGGPRNRLGLSPSRDSRRWTTVDGPGDTAVLAPSPAGGDLERTMQATVRKRPGPLGVWQSGDYLCFYYDHGLGDARFIQRVIATVTDPTAAQRFWPAGTKETRRPFLLAVATGLRNEPKAILKDLSDAALLMIGRRGRGFVATRLRRQDAPAQAPAPSPTPAPSQTQTSPTLSASASPNGTSVSPRRAPDVVVRVSAPLFIDQLREFRDANWPSTSTTALIMFAMCQALESAGATIDPDIHILADYRRFLPPSATTLANFCGVVKVPFTAETTPKTFGASLVATLTSYTSMLTLRSALAFAQVRYAGRRRPEAGRWRSSGEHRTVLTISDYTKVPDDLVLQWADRARSEIAVVIEPANEEHLAVVLSRSATGSLTLAASFDEDHLARGVVETAMADVLDVAWYERHLAGAPSRGTGGVQSR